MSSLRKGLLMRIAPTGKKSEDVNNEVKKRGNNGFSASQAILLRKLRKTHPLPDFKITKLILWEILNDPIASQAFLSPPTGDNVNNCWKFVNTGTPNKITWYFYVDPQSIGNVSPGKPDWVFPVSSGAPPSLYKVSDLEAFYFNIKVNNNNSNNFPYPTIYTRMTTFPPDEDKFYTTRINYTGLHDTQGLPPGNYTFTIGDTSKLSITQTYNNGTLYDLNTYDISATNLSGGSVLPSIYREEPISAIALGTDSSAPAGRYDFCLKEVGYKFKGQQQQVFRTVVA